MMKVQILCATLLLSTCISMAKQSTTFACGNAVLIEEDVQSTISKRRLKRASIKMAERYFQARKYHDAIRIVMHAKPTIENDLNAYPKYKDKLLIRGLKIVAVSTVRLRGAVTLDKKALHLTIRRKRKTRRLITHPNARTIVSNFAWATKVLEHLQQSDKTNPELQTYLGEAYTLHGRLYGEAKHKRDAAMKLLKPLADKDLLVSAQGFAALAALYKTKSNKIKDVSQHKDKASIDKAKAYSAQSDIYKQRCLKIINEARLCSNMRPFIRYKVSER